MRYVDKSRLKDFAFESTAAPETVVVNRDAKSHAESIYEDIAMQNPDSPRQRAFALFCGLSSDSSGQFRERLHRHAQTRIARERQHRLASGIHPRMLPG